MASDQDILVASVRLGRALEHEPVKDTPPGGEGGDTRAPLSLPFTALRGTEHWKGGRHQVHPVFVGCRRRALLSHRAGRHERRDP